MLTEEVGDLVERDLVQPIIEIDVVGARDDHKLFRLRRSWATEHGDSDFWYHCRTMGIPDSLAEKVELWSGKEGVFQLDLFTQDSWIAGARGPAQSSGIA
jgi:tryptophan halogenase